AVRGIGALELVDDGTVDALGEPIQPHQRGVTDSGKDVVVYGHDERLSDRVQEQPPHGARVDEHTRLRPGGGAGPVRAGLLWRGVLDHGDHLRWRTCSTDTR